MASGTDALQKLAGIVGRFCETPSPSDIVGRLTRSFPDSLTVAHRGFAFYLAGLASSVPSGPDFADWFLICEISGLPIWGFVRRVVSSGVNRAFSANGFWVP